MLGSVGEVATSINPVTCDGRTRSSPAPKCRVQLYRPARAAECQSRSVKSVWILISRLCYAESTNWYPTAYSQE